MKKYAICLVPLYPAKTYTFLINISVINLFMSLQCEHHIHNVQLRKESIYIADKVLVNT